MINSAFMNSCLFKYNDNFYGGQVIFENSMYDIHGKWYIRIKGVGVVKQALLIFIIKIYEWHLITQTNYMEQVLQLRL
jgi:hypothetical protein